MSHKSKDGRGTQTRSSAVEQIGDRRPLALIFSLADRRPSCEQLERARLSIERIQAAARSALAAGREPTAELREKISVLASTILSVSMHIEDALPARVREQIDYDRELLILIGAPRARPFVEKRAAAGSRAARRALAEYDLRGER